MLDHAVFWIDLPHESLCDAYLLPFMLDSCRCDTYQAVSMVLLCEVRIEEVCRAKADVRYGLSDGRAPTADTDNANGCCAEYVVAPLTQEGLAL
jgi:hypothetical protein